jgi:hypothetical protein
MGEPVRSLRAVSDRFQQNKSVVSYPTDDTAIATPSFTPIMLGCGVICATQVGGNESKAPEKQP